MTHHGNRAGERGVAALSLLTVGALIALAIFAFMAVPFTNASDAKAKNRSAADAAALAGAEWVLKDLEVALTTEGWLGDWRNYQPFVGNGMASARTYAERNKSELIAYEFSFINWEAHATVRGRKVDGTSAESDARATIDLPSCQMQTPEPTPSPTEEPDPAKKPPPPPPTSFDCGGVIFDVPAKGPAVLPPGIIARLMDLTKTKLID